jgi:hypothetical protein
MLRSLLVVSLLPSVLLGAAACSGSSSSSTPTTPTPLAPVTPITPVTPVAPVVPRLDLTGTWRGTLSLRINGTQSLAPITAAPLTQSGLSVTGSYQADGREGTLTGTLTSESEDARLNGTLRLSSPSPIGGICTGSGTFTGTVSPSIGLTAPVFTVDCPLTVSDVSITLTR